MESNLVEVEMSKESESDEQAIICTCARKPGTLNIASTFLALLDTPALSCN